MLQRPVETAAEAAIHTVYGLTFSGAPETIRTSDLPLRRRLLYPAELPGQYIECERLHYISQ